MLSEVPRRRWIEAVELLVSPLPKAVQERQKAIAIAALDSDPAAAAGLLGDFCDGALCAVCWLQPQPGRTAHLWPPVAATTLQPNVVAALVSMALQVARRQGDVLVQSLLDTDAGDEARLLCQAGFTHVADLLYLVSLAERFPSAPPPTRLAFIPLPNVEDRRMERLVAQTYVDSCDCPALEGVRSIDDVLAGYRAVGSFRPDLWLIAQLNDQDVGCILLTDHRPDSVWELVYLGVVPQSRGLGIGLEMTRYTQWLAAQERIARLVLAVDAANQPAIDVYASAGFVSWDRRSVFVDVTGLQTR